MLTVTVICCRNHTSKSKFPMPWQFSSFPPPAIRHGNLQIKSAPAGLHQGGGSEKDLRRQIQGLCPVLAVWQSTAELFSIDILLPQLRALLLVGCHHPLAQLVQYLQNPLVSLSEQSPDVQLRLEVRLWYSSESRMKYEHNRAAAQSSSLFAPVHLSFYSC